MSQQGRGLERSKRQHIGYTAGLTSPDYITQGARSKMKCGVPHSEIMNSFKTATAERETKPRVLRPTQVTC